MKGTILGRVNLILTSEERGKGIFLILLLTASSFLDVFSIASLLPLLLVVINPANIFANRIILGLYEAFQFTDHIQFGLFLVVAFLSLIGLKTVLATWLTYHKARFAYAIANDRAMRAVDKYFNSAFQDFTKSDFSVELNRITNTPLIFANNIIIPTATVYAESVVSLILLAAIAIADPLLFAFMGLLFVPVLALYKIQKKSAGRSSQAIKAAYPELVGNSLQAIHSFVEIRTFEKQPFFKRKIKQSYDKIVRIFSQDHTRTTGLSRVSELVAALVIGMLVIYILLYHSTTKDTILLLAVYVGASFRAIPSVNRIVSSLIQIRSHEFSIEEMERLREVEPKEHKVVAKKPVFNRSLELRNIHFSYGTNILIRDLNLTIRKGDKVLITGNSGSGKSTLLLLIMRLLRPASGEILVDERISGSEDEAGFRKLIGYVSQNPAILNGTIAENIAFGAEAGEGLDFKKIVEVARNLQLEEWIESLPQKYQTTIGENGARISGGQRQRIALARALYYGAEIFVLDEITNQVHREVEEEIWNLFTQFGMQGKTLIAVSHQPTSRKFFDVVYQLASGTLVSRPGEASVVSRQ